MCAARAQAERHEEMVEFMKRVARTKPKMELEERNLLSVAYKNVVSARRASLRVISSIEAKEQEKGGGSSVLPNIAAYRSSVEDELQAICNDVLALIDDYCLENAPETEPDSHVFYQKMKADYHRYIAEYSEGDKKQNAAKDADEAYKAAHATADKGLAVTHPIRLGLALNYSVFQYEVLGNPDEACKMARTAFEDAIAELDNVAEDSYKDSTLIMQLLRDNLTLWTSDQEGGEQS